MFIVFLSNWVEGSGTSYTEEFDHLDNYMTAQEYILNYDGDLASKKVGEDIKISITDEECNELSAAWVSEVIEISSLKELYIVELSYFEEGKWNHQQIDRLENWINPVDYYLNYKGDIFSGIESDNIKITVYDFDDPSYIDHCFISKDGEIKRQLKTMPFDKDGRHATGYEIYINGAWVDEYEPKEN
jgi:hypothetical protein